MLAQVEVAEFVKKHEEEMAAFKEDCKVFKEKNEAEKDACRAECEEVRLGLHTVIKPLLSHSTTGEFNSPPK
eukprot:3138719-Pyramimonas_sp.AAC.1